MLIVLMVVAIITAILGRMVLSNEIWMKRVDNGAALIQARQAMRAAQWWTALILEQDDPGYDGLTDIWSQSMPDLPVNAGFIGGHIEDLQARFNVNNLINDAGKPDILAVEKFRRLLFILELNPGIAEAIVDWIDPDDVTSGGSGAEYDYYQALNPGYRTPNRLVYEISELRMVRGISPVVWDVLEPYVTALPLITSVNVNTAAPEVLAAMVTEWGPPLIALGEARRWHGQIDRKPARDLETFAAMALGGPDRIVAPDLSVNTEYFMSHTWLLFGGIEQGLATVYYRNNSRTLMLGQSREFHRKSFSTTDVHAATAR